MLPSSAVMITCITATVDSLPNKSEMDSAAVSSGASGALESSSGVKFWDRPPRTTDTITVTMTTTHGNRRTTVDSPVTNDFTAFSS